MIASVLIGAIPAVMLGARYSARGADHYIRPILALTLVVSALALLGASNGWLLAVMVAGIGVLGGFWARGRRRRRRSVAAVTGDRRLATPTDVLT